MKSTKAILLIPVAAVVVAGVLWPVCASKRGPVYKWKKMSVWIDALGDGSLDTFTLEREFAKMGPDALPAVTGALTRESSFFDNIYGAIYPRLPNWVRSKVSRPCDAYSGRLPTSVVEALGNASGSFELQGGIRTHQVGIDDHKTIQPVGVRLLPQFLWDTHVVRK